MSSQLLATELANLVQESKRKNNDLRQAAEKSLEELKGLKGANEAQVAAELAQRPNFVNPFIIACGTKNAKFTAIAIVCLQRLIVSKALPRSKLNQVLEALREASNSGLDVQLKILQALPSLLQNYSADVQGDLLVTALNICFILQSSKNAIVNNTSAATLQQLVVFVFDKIVTEDRNPGDAPIVGEAPAQKGTVQLRSAALDAYRIFNDLCLLTENQRPEYLRFTGLPQTFGLELIESVLTNHASVFSTHPEQANILRLRVMPFIISALRGKPNFATSVRLVRILYTILRRHLSILPTESGHALDILTHVLDQDTTLWKRSLCMEVFRGIFTDGALLRRIFALYDAKDDEKDILKTLIATFVRLSTEKPAVIGLGHQSTIPVANPYASVGSSTEQAMLESTGVAGIISSSVSTESHNTGISSQWSSVRVPCIDQLDKTEPPSIPESYIYSLTLSCVSSLSEGLAKFILPLTVPSDSRSRKRTTKTESGRDSPAPLTEQQSDLQAKGHLERSASFKKNPVPQNPLLMEDHPLYEEVKICAAIVDECWPAILATCSTFLYAALDSEYYHGLVRAFQKFAHVAGLLQLTTPRDAFLTTLGKAAVPPNVFTACLNAGAPRPPPATPTADTPNSLLSNARGLLSVDSLVNQGSPTTEKGRQLSVDGTPMTLNTRNLLCLRALLNLGIALGPTLGPAWRIVLETLQQADFVLFSSSKAPGRTPTATRVPDQQAEGEANQLLANFSTEIRAVETAGSRLIESTVDFPNTSFIEVVTAICNLLEKRLEEPQSATSSQAQSPPSTATLKAPTSHRRNLSISTSGTTGSNQEDQFALAKLGDLATINIERLLAYPPDISGWTPLTSELIRALNSTSLNASVRTRAADILVRLVLEAANVATPLPDSDRGKIQLMLLEAFRDALLPLQQEDRDVSVANHATDIEIHKIILEGLKSMLESCGESLVSGWVLAFEIIGTIFVARRFPSEDRRGSHSSTKPLMTRSAKLIRSSFNSLQLICSDFLASLPNACFLILVDTLYKFSSQDDDLNIALTTVTFFWVLSDFLSGKNESLSITGEVMKDTDQASLAEMAADPTHSASDASLWMLLLLRLTSVTADDRLELRNSAIQTLLRIFDAYGDKLSAEAWSICIKSVIFKLLSSIEDELRLAKDHGSAQRHQSDWNETAVVVLNSISELLRNYLEVLTLHSSFNGLWRDLLEHLATLLDFEILDINAAVYKALAHILAPNPDGRRPSFDKMTVDLAWELWSRGIPVSADENGAGDNQNCLIAYISALKDVYRLIQSDLNVERVKRMLTLLRQTMQQATVGTYVVDVEYATQLQGQILDAVKMVRTDLPGVPSAMIMQVAEFVSLAFDDETMRSSQSSQKRTYIAMSKASMTILQALILRHASDPGIYSTGAFSAALSALSKPVVLKYSFPIVTKSIQPWRLATTTTLAILEPTLPQLRILDIPSTTIQNTWHIIVAISNGIINADCNAAPSGTNIGGDESFDIAAFQKLRDLIIPSLGTAVIPDATRKTYAESLFKTSIIHAPSPAEAQIIYGTGNNNGNDGAAGLGVLYKTRSGRTVDPAPTKREKMSYVCLDELFALVSSHEEASAPTILVQPPTPKTAPPQGSALGESPLELHIRIARIVAPFLILRAALALRTYVADQPLRGRMPQPLSQRRELVRVLRRLVDLKSEPEAIPDTAGVESESRKHLLRLYPLIVAAVRVSGKAGDEAVAELLVEALEVVGGELGM